MRGSEHSEERGMGKDRDLGVHSVCEEVRCTKESEGHSDKREGGSVAPKCPHFTGSYFLPSEKLL